jgi:hypothetical protein
MKGAFLAVFLGAVTVGLVVVGTLWPVPAALAYTGGQRLLESSSTPEAAVRNLSLEIRAQDWQKAYSDLANRAEFSESEFERDVSGYYTCLRTYSSLTNSEISPIHASDNDADIQLTLNWATVVGTIGDTRTLHVVKNGDRWQVEWPLGKKPAVPPQVVPVEYLRWDVINRGPGDDWGVQDVDAPSIKIVDMHPVQRAEGVVVMGELLNQDVVPAYVSVGATLQAKNDAPIATASAFDMISHLLLPKQVTPFLIRFPDVSLSEVGSIRMEPFSMLVTASADPVIEIDNEHYNPGPSATLSGELKNESGQVVNVAHVLGTLYDKNGQLVWVVDQYIDRALLPQTPVAFNIPVPEDLAKQVSSDRTVVATFSFGGAL